MCTINGWTTKSWFNDWCTGANKTSVPDKNSFKIDYKAGSGGLTLPQACPTTCAEGKINCTNHFMKFSALILYNNFKNLQFVDCYLN